MSGDYLGLGATNERIHSWTSYCCCYALLVLASVSKRDDYVRVKCRTGMDYSCVDRNGIDELYERFYLSLSAAHVSESANMPSETALFRCECVIVPRLFDGWHYVRTCECLSCDGMQ